MTTLSKQVAALEISERNMYRDNCVLKDSSKLDHETIVELRAKNSELQDKLDKIVRHYNLLKIDHEKTMRINQRMDDEAEVLEKRIATMRKEIDSIRALVQTGTDKGQPYP